MAVLGAAGEGDEPSRRQDGEAPVDVAILGGGLSGCLTALACARHRPAARVVLVEGAAELAGNHTWCCFASDLDGRVDVAVDADGDGDGGAPRETLARQASELLDVVVTERWSRHRVRFPAFERTLDVPYWCVTADRLRDTMASSFEAAPMRRVMVGARVREIERHDGYDTVVLTDGRRVRARRVLDARGSSLGPAIGDGEAGHGGSGFQKFVGREVTLRGWTGRFGPDPLVMDAAVPQRDGFRFMYVLPLGSSGRVLLEDTSFSDGPALDLEERRGAIDAYARGLGLEIEQVHREESGVLPMPAGNPTPPPGRTPDGAAWPAIGYAGGLFHAGTGYALPIAASVAVALATASDPAGDPWPALRPIQARLRAQNRFFVLLNRLMFLGVAPALRWHIFARFYGLPVETIARFYAARTTLVDRARILVGRPPPGLRWRPLMDAFLQMNPEAPHDLAPRAPGDDRFKEAT